MILKLILNLYAQPETAEAGLFLFFLGGPIKPNPNELARSKNEELCVAPVPL